MSVFRVTTFFGQANTGWSETWWRESANFGTIANNIADMIEFRNTLLTDLHYIVAIRASEEGKQRRSKLYLPGAVNINGGQQVVQIPGTGDFPEGQNKLAYDQVRSCMQIDLSFAGRRISKRYLAGIPDSITKTETKTLDFSANPQWTQIYRNWTAFMIREGWGIQAQVTGDANPEQPIIRWLLREAAPSVIGCMMKNPRSFVPAVGDQVMVRATRMSNDGQRSPNGRWTVDAIESNTDDGTITVWLRNGIGIDPSSIKSLGFVRRRIVTVVVPDVIEPVRAGIHKRGKVFGSPVGRAKRKRYSS